MIDVLNQQLTGAIALRPRQRAQWNLKGSHFIELQELFDKAAEEIEEFIDGIARVHPLLGGFDAWRKRNYPAESRVVQASTVSISVS
jgi:starvation-inducible DNA-binding protein